MNKQQLASKIWESANKMRSKIEANEYKDYNGVRQILVFEGLLAKFSQNQELKRNLLATGDNTLAECAVKDRIWGIGLSMTDPARFDRNKWKGQNLLGYTLMMVRSCLLKQEGTQKL